MVRYYGKTKAIVEGRPRKPVREYLLKQGRFAHFTEEDLDYFQAKVDEMWTKWEIPGVVPFKQARRRQGGTGAVLIAWPCGGWSTLGGAGRERRLAPPCCFSNVR